MMLPRFFYGILIVAFVSTAAGDSDNECVYTLYVKTGSIIKAGTDSKIGVTLGDATGRSVWVPNLKSWGLMGSNHDYYERDGLDIFSGIGACIGGPLCRLNVTSDGSGSHHGWYCDYIQVTSTGPHKHCHKAVFYVQQWLATDVSPFQLTAIVDACKGKSTKTRSFVVRNVAKSASASG